MKRFEGVCEWLDERCEFFEKRGEEFFQDPYLHSFKLCQYRFLLQSSTNMQVLCFRRRRGFSISRKRRKRSVQVGEVGEVEEGGLLQEQKGEEEKEVDFLQEKKEEEEEKEEEEKVEMEEEEEEEVKKLNKQTTSLYIHTTQDTIRDGKKRAEKNVRRRKNVIDDAVPVLFARRILFVCHIL